MAGREGDGDVGETAAGATDDAPLSDAEVRDQLPADLDATLAGAGYRIPDNARRRIPGMLLLAVASASAALWALSGDEAVLVNDGFLWGAIGLGLFGLYSVAAAQHVAVDEIDALVSATRAVGFPVGHAAAQLGWRGFRSRPTWRILLFSAEEPPLLRGLVLVDAVDGTVLDHVVEDNPEVEAA